MSDQNTLAKYSFLPWLRQGLVNNITSNPPANAQRASINVVVDIGTDTGLKATADTTIQLVGPGDIIGISRDAIVRHEPRDWITDFEPNYLAYIEFYDEDFLWRYSPMPADTGKHRITPWITLVVLKEDEFKDPLKEKQITSKALSGTLPFFETTGNATNVFPPTSQLWAWAHVHVNLDLTVDSNGNQLSTDQSVDRLENLLNQNPDLGYSRLLCPRELEPKTSYHAFLIPTFEPGRLAGLGEKIPSTVGALDFAWENGQIRFPYYYRWYFRTSVKGDFEYLVRLLKPRSVDKRVGIRDMDVSEPGGGVDGIDFGPDQPKVIGMEGALRSPETKSTDWPKNYPEKFQKQLSDHINKADDYQQANPDSDPVVTPPLYARWHALRQRLSLDPDVGANPYDPQAKWLTELNLDPRHRAAAGLGTRVVQKHQEEYMNDAWEQIGEVLEANRRLKLAQLAEAASFQLYNKHLQPLHETLKLSLTSPVHKRVLGSEQTVHRKVQKSKLPSGTLSPEFRKIVRPRGPISAKLLPEAERRPQPDLLNRINNGEITATPPKVSPSGNISLDESANQLAPSGPPEWLQKLLRNKWFTWLPLLLAIFLVLLLLLLGVTSAGLVVGILVATGLIAITIMFNRWAKAVDASDTICEENLTPEAVDQLPNNPTFQITDPGDTAMNFPPGDTDSSEARKFKAALRDLHTVFTNLPEPASPKPKLVINELVDSIMMTIEPRVAIPKRVLNAIFLPPIIRARIADRIVPVMAYPEFPQPMYEPLRDISTDFLIPNINLVPQNTISLLVTNQRFIESYMVGLNHEMGRELLWREYVTDQRGSYFRQFWDVHDVVNKDPALTEKQLVEKLKDILEIHTWLSTTPLGTHNHRESGGDTTQLVLLIRGDLLKRYPNTVIYAHRAEWQKDNTGNILKDKSRKLAPITTEAERAAHEKYPLYSAKIEPDIFFLGFDLTVEEAKGVNENDPGWFFVLKERPGEPRFGLDLEDKAVDVSLNEWDDLSWSDIQDDLASGNHIFLTSDKNKIKPANNPDDVEWHSDSNAADLAYILFQDPVLVAVHAQEMLKRLKLN